MSRTLSPRTLSPTAAFVGVALAFTAFFLAAGAPTPLLALRQEEWGFSAATLTIAFAVYPFALLAAVLVGGSLSDHLGRRPVLLAALGVELVAMVMFLVAPTIGWVIVARVVQGIATGLATSAFSAAIIEHAPDRHKRLAATIVSTVVAGGLGVGSLLTGLAVQYSSHANALTFTVLAAVMLAGLVVVALTPETTSRRAGAVSSLAPRIAVPRSVRAEFLAGIPAYTPGWMLGAFFLGLTPVVLRSRFGLDGGAAGYAAFVGMTAAAFGTLVFARVAARRTTVIGSALMIVGTLLIITGVGTTSLPVLWAGEVLGGAGLGAAFGGHLRLVGQHVGAAERAGLFGGIYTAAYLAFGLPAVVAGQLDTHIGILPTVDGYAGLILVVAVVGLVVQVSRHLGERAAARATATETVTAPVA